MHGKRKTVPLTQNSILTISTIYHYLEQPYCHDTMVACTARNNEGVYSHYIAPPQFVGVPRAAAGDRNSLQPPSKNTERRSWLTRFYVAGIRASFAGAQYALPLFHYQLFARSRDSRVVIAPHLPWSH